MTNRRLNFAVVISTAGSVIDKALTNEFFRSRVRAVIADRPCAALDKARAHGLPVQLLAEKTPERFCERLLPALQAQDIDYIFSYYTRFYSRPLRDAYQDRVINFHPSLLPAFKGMDGFGDTVAYHARFAGNTVEFIDQVMDEGKIIMQTAAPFNLNVPLNHMRHTVFVQQCRALLQVAKWLQDGRISVQGRQVVVDGATFDDPHFSPALDDEEIRQWELPLPGDYQRKGM